jgi:tetratricopeptide (TPR) repeat protein
LPIVLIVGWYCYRGGLTGIFLFDDFNNLSALGAYGRVDNWRTFAFYITSGTADPLGRPLALLSFLLDANDWPAAPEPFKHTNVLLHLLNGVLLLWVLLKLGGKLGLEQPRNQQAAVLGAAFWMLHPYWVSTTLYVVQREAMLPATFVLLGMLLWITGRERFLAFRNGGMAMLATGAGACTVMAMLAKGNGILLPLLLLVTDCFLLDRDSSTSPRRNAFQRVRHVLLGAPSGLIGIYLLVQIPLHADTPNGFRAWTAAQRLITEPRVVLNYLSHLWIPRASLSSLFNDSYPASKDLLHPWTTLPSLLIVGGLLAIGLAVRKLHPATAFAIVFFFAGHLLESTVIPLELYFEHRNYLPALPMFWPLALWLTDSAAPLPRLRPTLSVAILLILAVLTYERADLWGAPVDQAKLLAKVDPASPRAQIYAATAERAEGRPDLAVLRLRQAAARFPDDLQLTLNLVDAECSMGGLSQQTAQRTLYSLRSEPIKLHTEFADQWLNGAIEHAKSGRCTGFGQDVLEEMVDAVRRNPNFSTAAGQRQALAQIEGRIALAQADSATALRWFNEALDAKPSADVALFQASLLGAARYPRQGLEHLAYFKMLTAQPHYSFNMTGLHLWLLNRLGYWTSDLVRIEHQLREDAGLQSDPQ